MAKLVYGLNQSLDGYVDHIKIGATRSRALSSLHRAGAWPDRRGVRSPQYEIMRCWDDDLPDWDAQDRDFAAVWRSQRTWVVSRSLKSVGPNATFIEQDFEAVIRRLKAELDEGF